MNWQEIMHSPRTEREEALLARCSDDQRKEYTRDRIGRLLLNYLDDPAKAHIGWLVTAKKTVNFSLKNEKGKIYQWVRNGMKKEDFYPILKAEIKYLIKVNKQWKKKKQAAQAATQPASNSSI